MMNRKTILIVLCSVLVVAAALTIFLSLKPGDGIMTRKGDAYVVNTTKLTPKVCGYAGAVPLEVTIVGDKVKAIKALPNQETPEFFNSAKNKIFKQYIGKSVSQALALRPDAMTGATYSSGAIIANVHEALKYYSAHK